MSSYVSCSERKFWSLLLIKFEDNLWFLLVILPLTIEQGSSIGSFALSALYSSCTSTSSLCMHSSQASHLLFELLFYTVSFSVFCLHYQLVPTACLIFYDLLLAHPKFLYLACLTMLGHFLVLQKTLHSFFHYALVLHNKFLAALSCFIVFFLI